MATADRDYIIQRAKTRALTADMFEFEKLKCPYNLSSLFSYDDIWKLYELASSPKWTSKPKQKTEEINSVMRRRGFVKLQGGTNRICYRFLEDTSFVVKTAFDGGGLKDNPAEYTNQRYLNPFCTKVFECAPNGVIASFERVKAIKSREEYYTIHREVYDLITKFLIPCGLLMEDIGTEYFMNIGVREGFGPVLLDFSFLYQIDEKKLYCTKPDMRSVSGMCDGEIDYDPGYNFLYCTKCGCKYKASEVAKRIAANTTSIRHRKNGGRKVMKFEFNGGDLNKKEVVETKNEYVSSIPSMEIKPSTIKTEANTAPKQNVSFSLSNRAERREGKSSLVLDIKRTTVSTETKEEEKEEVKVEEQPKIDVTIAEPTKAYEIITEVPKIDEEEEPEDVYEGTLTVDKEDEVKQTLPEITEENVNEEKVYEPAQESVISDHSDGIDPMEQITSESFKAKLFGLIDEYKYLKSIDAEPEVDVNAFVEELCEFDPEFKSLIKLAEEESGDYYFYEEEEGDNNETPVEEETNVANDDMEAANAQEEEITYDSEVSRFEGVVVDLHDVVSSTESENVILIKNIDAPGYVTVGDNQLFVIDMIDGSFINSLTMVSKDYLENLENQVSEYENVEVKEAPTGV